MEPLHDPDSRNWISNKINLNSYFNELVQEVEKCEVYKGSFNSNPSAIKLSQMIGIKDKNPKDASFILKQIEEATSLEFLSLNSEEEELEELQKQKFSSKNIKKYTTLPIPKSGPSRLKTLYYQEKFLEKSKCNPKLQNRRKNTLMNFNDTWFECRHDDPVKLNRRLFNKEILVVIRVYRPMKYDPVRCVIMESARYTQELYLLGRNKLTELRDHIKCTLDHTVSEDLSNNPKGSTSVKTGRELYKSGFLFINDCFYNDMRWPDCIDYSKVITDWTNQPGRKFGQFSTAKMEDTCIKDLEIRLGYPYVYVHHGEHEHLFSFVDVRLLSANDPQDASQYPYERSVGVRHAKNCMICSIFIAKWITTDNDRVPEDPFYFCENCFLSFNYDENDKKIGNFKAHKYVDDNAI